MLPSRAVVHRLIACAIILCLGAPLHASIVTYRYSGTHFFHTGSFPGGTPSAFSGTIAYDNATPLDTSGWPDWGTYSNAYPPGQSGISIATNTGYVFATDPNSSSPTVGFNVQLANGPNLFSNDVFHASGFASNLPEGWTNGGVEFMIHGNRFLNQSFLNFSKAMPSSLPTFASPAEMSFNIDRVFVLIEVSTPSLGFARFRGEVTRLEHLSTASEEAVTSTGAPITTDLGGGSATVGGASVGFTPSSAGTFQETYNTVSLDQLPTTAPFSTGNFLLDVPGETLQYWDLHYTGDLQGPATVTFHFDPNLVTSGSPVGIWHYVDGPGWEFLGGTIAGNTITVTTDSFSPFALAVAPVPEPSGYLLSGIALLGLLMVRPRRARFA